MAFVLNLHAAQKFIRVLADSAGLGVVYEEGIVAPRTDGRRIYVPAPNYKWSDDEATKWLFYVYHELGHNVPEMRDCFAIAKKKKIHMQSFLGVMMNLLDDYRQEHFKYDEYEGKRKIMSKGRSLLLTEQLDNFEAPRDDKSNMLRAAYAYVTRNGEDWMPDLIGLSTRMYDVGDTQQKEWIDVLKTKDYDSDLNALRTAEDVYNLSKKIIKEVFKLDPEKEEEEAKKMYKEAGGDGECGEEKDGKKDEKKGSGKGKSKERTIAGKMRYDDILIHKHDEGGSSYAPLEIDYTDSRRMYDEYLPYSTNEFDVKDLTTLMLSDQRRYDEIKVDSTGFSNKIKRLLTIMSKDKYEYGKKRGYLHNSNLHRVIIKDSKSYSEKIFKQKKESEILDTAVSILVDMSGSMCGQKIVHAAQACILLNDAIAKLGVPVEIAGFTEHDPKAIHYLFKKFDTRCEGEHLKERIREASKSMLQNADGDSILFAYNRLIGRKEKKKVLIVLSDGQPCADRGSGIAGFTKNVVENIEKQKKVEIYGIGIISDAVRHFYKQYKVLRSSEELETVLLEIVRDKLLNNQRG